MSRPPLAMLRNRIGLACLLAGTIVFLVAGSLYAFALDDPVPDLIVAKQGAALVAPGGGVTYTLTVTNTGQAPALDVVLTDTMDAPLAYAGASDGGVLIDDATVRWALLDIPAATAVSVQLSARLPITAPLGSVTNRAEVTGGTLDEPLRHATSHTGGVAPADVAVHVISRQADVVVAELMTHTLVVTNVAAHMAEAIDVDVTLAANTAWVTDTSRAQGYEPTRGPGVLRFERTSLAGESAVAVDIVVRVLEGAVGTTLSHVAAVSTDTLDDALANNTSTSTPVRVEASGPPAAVEIAVSGTLAVDGEPATIEVRVTDSRGRPVKDGTAVTLDTTMGRLDELLLTTSSGWVTTTLEAGQVAGLANVSARSGSAAASRMVRILAGPPHELTAETDVTAPVVGQDVKFVVDVRDRFGNACEDGTSIRARADHGTTSPGTASTVDGRAELVWRNTVAGPASVTFASGGAEVSRALAFRPSVPGAVQVDVAPGAIGLVDGRATLTATVRDAYGNIVEDGWLVSFGSATGGLEPLTAETVSGVATTNLRAGSVTGSHPVWAMCDQARGEAAVDVRPANLVVDGVASGPRGRARESRTYPGETLRYDVVVHNRDLATARDVYLASALSDVLDDTFVEASTVVTATAHPPSGLDAGSPPGHSQRFWRLPDIGAGESVTLTVSGRLDPARSWEAHQTLFYRTVVTTTTRDESTADLTFTDQAGVYASDHYVTSKINPGASILRPGGLVVYDIDFGNNTVADDGVVRITDTLPVGTVYDHWQPGPRTDARQVGAFGPGSRELVWEVDGSSAVAGGLRLWLSIEPSVPTQTFLENRLSIGSTVFDLDESNNRYTDGVWLQGVNLAATVEGPATVQPGDVLRYELHVSNRATVDAATDLVVESIPPRGLSVLRTEPEGEAVAGGRVRWRLARLVPGGNVVLAMDVQVPNDAPVGATYQLTVDVSSSEPESYPIDNRAALTTRVVPGAATFLSVRAGSESLEACSGASTTLTATVEDKFGNPVADGATVLWQTTAGTLSAAHTVTEDGVAKVVLSASPRAGVAIVEARSGALSDRASVRMVAGAPVALAVTADPMAVGWGGETILTVNVLDGCGNPVADGWPIELQAERGTFQPGTARTILPTSSSSVRARLSVGEAPGPLRVTAKYGAEIGEAVITVFDRPALRTLYLPAVGSS